MSQDRTGRKTASEGGTVEPVTPVGRLSHSGGARLILPGGQVAWGVDVTLPACVRCTSFGLNPLALLACVVDCKVGSAEKVSAGMAGVCWSGRVRGAVGAGPSSQACRPGALSVSSGALSSLRAGLPLPFPAPGAPLPACYSSGRFAEPLEPQRGGAVGAGLGFQCW